MGISEEKMKIVINNYFKSECDVNTSIREAFEKGFRIGVKKGLAQSKAENPQTDLLVKTPHKSRDSHEIDTPQTDCGDFADRLAYERGVKHAWKVAQKVFDSTLTFYEAEDLAKQIADTPQTYKTCDNCGTPRDKCVYCIEEDRMWTPQTDRDAYWKELHEVVVKGEMSDASLEELVEGMKNLKMEVKHTDCGWK